jgi:cell division protein FtsB
MLEFYKKRRWWSVVYSPLSIIFLLLLIVFLGRIVYDRYVIEREMAARRVEAELRVSELEVRRDMLQEKVDYLANERGIEAELRRNFDVVQPGEKVVIIVDDETTSTILPLATTTPPVPKPWYKFWE